MLHVAYYEVCTFSPELVSQLIVLSSFSLMPISLCLLFLDANFDYLKVLSKLQAGSIEGQVAEIGLTSTSLINTEKLPVVVPNSLFSSQVMSICQNFIMLFFSPVSYLVTMEYYCNQPTFSSVFHPNIH
jgi:hypothetical protein